MIIKIGFVPLQNFISGKVACDTPSTIILFILLILRINIWNLFTVSFFEVMHIAASINKNYIFGDHFFLLISKLEMCVLLKFSDTV